MVLAILSRYYKHNFRGVETFVDAIVPRLQKLGHAVTIYPDSSSLATGNHIVISLNGRLDNVRAKLWTTRHQAKLVVSGQSGLGFDDRLNLFTFPDTFVCLTNAQQNWAKSVNPLVTTTIIPNGVDTTKFHPDVTPAKFDLPHPIIICVGALGPSKSGEVSKRQELLIKATAPTPASLLLVGRGSAQVNLQRLGSHLLGPRFKIMSFSHDQMPSVYANSDLFAYPTVPWESFGIAMLEAMASGLPVVATDDPIRREIVGPAGLFVDPVDTSNFSAALNRALTTSWANLPVNQAKKYDWDQIALQYDQLFRKLCSR